MTLTPLEFKLVLLMSNRPNEVVSDQEIYAVMVAEGTNMIGDRIAAAMKGKSAEVVELPGSKR